MNAEGFQRLLAAAYILQAHHDRPPVQPIGAGHRHPFAAGAVVQKRTPSLLIRNPKEQQAAAGHAAAPGSAVPKQSPLHPGKLMPLVGPAAMNIVVSRSMVWRTVEALAIATVFCSVVGVSIHRGSPLPSRSSLPSEMAEQRNASQRKTLAAKVLSLPEQQPMVTRNSRQPAVGEADVIAEDIVIRYRKRAVDLRGQAAKKPTSSPVQAQLLSPITTQKPGGVQFTFGRDADMLAADTVVRYSTDSSASRAQDQNKAALNRQGYK